jgi:hypothetical protein
LGARKKEDREKIRGKIWAAIPEDYTVTAKYLKAKKICGTELLYKCLNDWVRSGDILQERRGRYRKTPWAGPARLTYSGKYVPDSMRGEIRSVDDLFAYIDFYFEVAYFLYVRFLIRVMRPEVLPSATVAHDMFETFFFTRIRPALASLAHLVWQKRDKLKLEEHAAENLALWLFRPYAYLKPEFREEWTGMTISQAMAKVRRETSDVTDEEVQRYYQSFVSEIKAEMEAQ